MKLLAYFPVFGWFFPMFLSKREDASWHARQGLGLFFNFAFWFGFIWFLTHGIPRFLKTFEIILLLVPVAAYLVFLLIGLINSLRDDVRGYRKPLPIIGKWAEKLRV